jgi:hypothetical protein
VPYSCETLGSVPSTKTKIKLDLPTEASGPNVICHRTLVQLLPWDTVGNQGSSRPAPPTCSAQRPACRVRASGTDGDTVPGKMKRLIADHTASECQGST